LQGKETVTENFKRLLLPLQERKGEKKRLQKACSRNERNRRRHEEERDSIDKKEAPMPMVVAGQVGERKTLGEQYLLLLLLTSRNKKKGVKGV
jgi:hypothetical protein